MTQRLLADRGVRGPLTAEQPRLSHRGQTHVDVVPVHEHVLSLVCGGLPIRAVAQAAHQSVGFVHGVLAGRWPTIRYDMAARLLAVDFRPRLGQSSVQAVGVARRVHALARQGWALDWQANRLGMVSGNLCRLTHATHVHYDRWRAADELFERLVAYAGPSRRAHNWAVRHGWAPPTAWTRDTIDDPFAWPAQRPRWTPDDTVDPRAVSCAVAGVLPPWQLTGAERRAVAHETRLRKGA